MTVVVTDTSPLVTFAFLRLDHLLPKMFGDLLVPPIVVKEAARVRYGFAGVDFSSRPHFVIRQPTDARLISRLKKEIDAGEAEALALAIEVNADLVLMDDSAARDAAQHLGLIVTGTVGLLLRAKTGGYIGPIRPILDRLRQELRFFISDSFYASALQLAGE